MNRITAAGVIALTLTLSACQSDKTASLNSASKQPSATFATLERITNGSRRDRGKQCLKAWRAYEVTCNVELRLWHTGTQTSFCAAYANSNASPLVLPRVSDNGRRCR